MEIDLNLLLLSAAGFFTSGFAAVFGMGGGVILIALMPGLVPMQSLIPIHGVVQLASNSSRLGLGIKHTNTDLLKKYIPGALIGALVGVPCIMYFPFEMLPLVLGVFVLIVAWVPIPKVHSSSFLFPTLGFIQMFLSLFVGATGLIASAFLFHQNLKKDELVITQAAFMTVSHTLKIIVYSMLGMFLLSDLYIALLLSVSVVLGSWAGTKVRGKVPERVFKPVFKGLVTILGVRLILKTFL